MQRRILYLDDLPDKAMVCNSLDTVQHYLLQLFRTLNHDRGQMLLPSIDEFSQRLDTPKELLWASFHSLKNQHGLDIDFQNGYYGSITYTPNRD